MGYLLKSYSWIVFVLLAGPVFADGLPGVPVTNPIYNKIAQDLSHDIGEYDGITLAPAERTALANAWKLYLKGNATTKNPLDATPVGAMGVWPPRPLPGSALPVNEADFRAVTLPKHDPAMPHSIRDIRAYTDARLGPALGEAVRGHVVEVEVVGETSERFAAEAAKKGRNLVRIPSLYENWDIEKFLDVSPGLAKPTVVIRIPPNEQLVKHYAQIVQLQGGTLKRAAVNEVDRAAYREGFKSSVTKLFGSLPEKPDYVSIGYGNEWEAALAGPDSTWNLESAKAYTGEDGLSGKLLKIQSKDNPGLSRNVLTLSHEKTIWGEATAFLAEGIVEQNPKAIYFKGSAGAVFHGANVYDISAPKSFSHDEPIKLANQSHALTHTGAATKQAGNGVTVRYGLHHGSTFSPTEQSADFLRDAAGKQIGTIDVEQSLVAKVIQDYNRNTRSDIEFGAVNVITDKPGEILVGEAAAAHDLTVVDAAKKKAAKLAAVQTVLDGITLREADPTALDAKRKELIQRALPGVDPAKIKMSGGVGKVDADPKRKLSYFIYTAKPGDEASNTILIPMATSRFDRFNYQTDEWWDAHKQEIDRARAEGRPAPRQDPAEVAAWLQKNGLSTNPDVLSLSVKDGAVAKTPLKEFLLREYLERFAEDGYVMLYRGAEKTDELAVWRSGQFPRGVRYWTPDANYGWRYGRKNSDFMRKTLDGQAPVFRFKVPKAEFVELVRKGDLVLGTELTKKVHESFEYKKRFLDQLAGNYDYLGEGKYGLEFEIRGAQGARDHFTRWFDGALSVEDMARARRNQIVTGTERLIRQDPRRTAELLDLETARLDRVQAEENLLVAIREGRPQGEIQALLAKVKGTAEITNIDDLNLSSLARDYRSKAPARPAVAVAPAKDCPGLYGAVAGAGR